MSTITKQKYENLKTKAFYIKQNPGQFVDALLDAAGITVKGEDAPATTIQLSAHRIEIEDEYQLTATVENAPAGAVVEWKSSDKGVVVVDNTGKVSTVDHGTAVVTASIAGVSDSCTVISK